MLSLAHHQAHTAQEWGWLHWPEVRQFVPRIPLRAGAYFSSRLHSISQSLFCWPASLALVPSTSSSAVVAASAAVDGAEAGRAHHSSALAHSGLALTLSVRGWR